MSSVLALFQFPLGGRFSFQSLIVTVSPCVTVNMKGQRCFSYMTVMVSVFVLATAFVEKYYCISGFTDGAHIEPCYRYSFRAVTDLPFCTVKKVHRGL